jgi:hypothetical protein
MSLKSQSVVGLEIHKCEIKAKGKTYEFKNAVTEYHYYEDIFINFAHGMLMISDSAAWQNLADWTGDETLTLHIKKPTCKVMFKGEFRIFNVQGKKLASDSNENHIVHFVSKTVHLNEMIKISRSYKNKKISDIVKDIGKRYLNIDIDVEPTYQPLDIVIPKLKPFEAINWLATLAIPEKYNNIKSGAHYFFWESHDPYSGEYPKYFFWPMHRLFDEYSSSRHFITPLSGSTGGGRGSGYWYGTKNLEDKYYTDWDEFEQIISFEVLNTYDTAESIRKGMFANRMFSLDYLRRVHKNADFNYNKYWKESLKPLNLYATDYGNSIKSFNSGEVDESIESTLKLYPSTTRQPINPYVILREADIKPNQVEHTVPYRYAQLSLMGHNRLKLVIPGDPYMPIGWYIRVHMPRISRSSPKELKSGELEDKYLSGWYLITAIHSVINQENEFQTVVECMKDAYHKPTPWR